MAGIGMSAISRKTSDELRVTSDELEIPNCQFPISSFDFRA
jgi:hypothetical protein